MEIIVIGFIILFVMLQAADYLLAECASRLGLVTPHRFLIPLHALVRDRLKIKESWAWRLLPKAVVIMLVIWAHGFSMFYGPIGFLVLLALNALYVWLCWRCYIALKNYVEQDDRRV